MTLQPLPTSATLTRFMPPTWEQDSQIAAVLPLVLRDMALASPQHPARAWEYSMAILSTMVWEACGYHTGAAGPGRVAIDAGGAGSPLEHMLRHRGWEVAVVDPAAPVFSTTIEEFAASEGRGRADAVFSISVLEHVENDETVLQACHQLLKLGGLCFLTVDAQETDGEGTGQDTKHFHWMRKRLYGPRLLRLLHELMLGLGFESLGRVDTTWHGPAVYDYSFFSLAYVKLR